LSQSLPAQAGYAPQQTHRGYVVMDAVAALIWVSVALWTG
jgi:hypothetical protein